MNRVLEAHAIRSQVWKFVARAIDIDRSSISSTPDLGWLLFRGGPWVFCTNTSPVQWSEGGESSNGRWGCGRLELLVRMRNSMAGILPKGRSRNLKSSISGFTFFFWALDLLCLLFRVFLLLVDFASVICPRPAVISVAVSILERKGKDLRSCCCGNGKRQETELEGELFMVHV